MKVLLKTKCLKKRAAVKCEFTTQYKGPSKKEFLARFSTSFEKLSNGQFFYFNNLDYNEETLNISGVFVKCNKVALLISPETDPYQYGLELKLHKYDTVYPVNSILGFKIP